MTHLWVIVRSGAAVTRCRQRRDALIRILNAVSFTRFLRITIPPLISSRSVMSMATYSTRAGCHLNHPTNFWPFDNSRTVHLFHRQAQCVLKAPGGSFDDVHSLTIPLSLGISRDGVHWIAHLSTSFLLNRARQGHRVSISRRSFAPEVNAVHCLGRNVHSYNRLKFGNSTS